jgi:hypothetical protein
MAVTHASATRNAVADAVVDRLDLGTTNAQGRILIYTAALATLLATLNMSNPAFGNAASGVATASAITSATAVASGTAAIAVFNDRNAAEVFRCAIGTSGSDINLSSTTISSGDTVAISSLTYTAPT